MSKKCLIITAKIVFLPPLAGIAVRRFDSSPGTSLPGIAVIAGHKDTALSLVCSLKSASLYLRALRLEKLQKSLWLKKAITIPRLCVCVCHAVWVQDNKNLLRAFHRTSTPRGTEIKRLVKYCWDSEGVLHVPFFSKSWTRWYSYRKQTGIKIASCLLLKAGLECSLDLQPK